MPGPEWNTRKALIDKALEESNWFPIVPYNTTEPRDLVVFEEYPTSDGPADYALFCDKLPLAVVEAKRVDTGPQNVLNQAQRYSKGFIDSPLNFNDYRVPFAYSSNGTQIWFRDLRNPRSRSRIVSRFHTPEALKEMLARDVLNAEDWLRSNPIDIPILRPYQKEAIAAVEDALQNGRRKMLVAMATGTGKTLTTISLLDRLMRSGYVKRILFLVDRRSLAAQAVLAFARFDTAEGLKFSQVYEVYSQRFQQGDFEDRSFDPTILPAGYLTAPNMGHAFVYVSTIQRMSINLFGLPNNVNWGQGDRDDDRDAIPLDIPIHAFDLIVADECHRGYTSTETGRWRQTLDHFDAIKIGLTATPAAHTIAFFERPVVYTYGYEQAIREGYLVDYEPITIQSRVTIEGAFLRPGEEVTLQDRETGEKHYEELEDERELPASALDAEWASPDRDYKVVTEVARYLREWEERTGRFPKTLVFAHDDVHHTSHSDRLVNLFRDEFGRGDDFVQKITGSPNVDRPLQRIREFRNRPDPAIVVTVDMLSTGVDIPALECVVFMRPIQSRILFEQMMGRGTRLCPDINKTHFMVCDAAGVISYFAGASDFTADPPTQPTRSVGDVVRDIYDNRNRKSNVRSLVSRLHRVARNITGEGREQFRHFIPDGDITAFARRLPGAIDNDWAATMQILQNPDFQDLMENYPRARSDFLIAESVEDEVVSGVMIRTADGRSVKPADYLAAFEEFIRENPDQITALEVLLSRPNEWDTEVLEDLRDKLAQRPEGFTQDRLRRAYQHQLADIISIVKHAATGEPLLSAQERVDRAMLQVRDGQTFTPEQEKWLNFIRNHLIQNLAIDREDFKLITFMRAGATWKRVNDDFDGELEALLKRINEAIAA